MACRVGELVWIPCEVKPGPFSNERFTLLRSDHAEWIGLVPVHCLREPVPEGRTAVRAIITELSEERFKARIEGEALASRIFEDALSRVEPLSLKEYLSAMPNVGEDSDFERVR
jgi:hypothetical protein